MDIVGRLREWTFESDIECLRFEAADEIERLRLIEAAAKGAELTFFEMIELKGRSGSRDGFRFKLGLWLTKMTLTALANDPQLRKELNVIIRVSKNEP